MDIAVEFCGEKNFEVAMNYTKAELLRIFGEFTGRKTTGDFGEKCFISEYAEYGDYDNSCEVERSNVRVLKALHYPAGSIGWGAYGHVYYAIEIDPDLMDRERWDELIEIFRGLEDYPCIDDEAMGEVMDDAVDDAWSDWIYGEFLGKVSDSICRQKDWYTCDIDHPVDLSDATRELFNELCNTAGEYPIMESGGSIWIDLDRLLKKAETEVITLANLSAMGFVIVGE